MKDGQKLSRKKKLRMWGRKVRGKKLKEMLSAMQIIRNKYPQTATILPYEFCPKCGCRNCTSTGNLESHPCVYIRNYCARCGYMVAMADNSPLIHCLECLDYEL